MHTLLDVRYWVSWLKASRQAFDPWKAGSAISCSTEDCVSAEIWGQDRQLSRFLHRTDAGKPGGRACDAGRRLATYRFSLPPTPQRVAVDQTVRVRRLTSVRSDGERTVTGLVGIGTDGLVHLTFSSVTSVTIAAVSF